MSSGSSEITSSVVEKLPSLTLNVFVEPLLREMILSEVFPEIERAALGCVVPIPSRLFESSQKRFELSWLSIPFVPAKSSDPAVGAYHVGEPVPPEMSA